MKKYLLTNNCKRKITRLKNNAFTLIELLAIIVILAILAVITVPIILNIVDTSKKGAAQDSAYGFKDAVNKAYLTQLLADSNYVIPDDTYTVDQLKTQIGLSLSGQEPNSNSWITIKNNAITSACLQFDEYKVSMTNNELVSIEKDECELVNNNIEVIKSGSTLATGDVVKLHHGDYAEEFIVILNDPKAPEGTTMLLAVNNIDTTTGYQGGNGSSYPVAFSGTNYWSNYSDLSDIYDSTKSDETGINYSVAYYVNMYVTNLRNLGFTGINSGRLLTYLEVYTNGLAVSYKGSGENYWLCSANTNQHVAHVDNSGNIRAYPANYDYSQLDGIRSVIYIRTSDIQ